MIVFWWTGKGYLTPIIVLGTMIVFGVILQAGSPVLHDGKAFCGVALIAAGIINWLVGRKQNARKLAAVRFDQLRHRLLYPARNKFMSLPFEVWAIPMVLGGLVAVGSTLIGR